MALIMEPRKFACGEALKMEPRRSMPLSSLRSFYSEDHKVSHTLFVGIHLLLSLMYVHIHTLSVT